jgi:hypothetical protein
VATREDGGLIRLDPIFHGWQCANAWVMTNLTKMTMKTLTVRILFVSGISGNFRFWSNFRLVSLVPVFG